MKSDFSRHPRYSMSSRCQSHEFPRKHPNSALPGLWTLLTNFDRKTTDFVYEEELQRFLESGALSELSVAFSREGPTKEYAQHKMMDKASDIWNIRT
ncbi:hypothetical protein YC2023_002479 [Brassica napus]